jgi:hypothetical protein
MIIGGPPLGITVVSPTFRREELSGLSSEPFSLGLRLTATALIPGRFTSPAGTPFEQRGLPVDYQSAPFSTYEVLSPIEVDAGTAAPAFGMSGLGIQ